MRIIDIVWEWWEFLCETISSICLDDRPVMIRGRQEDMRLMEAEAAKVRTIKFTPKSNDGHYVKCEAECDPVFDHAVSSGNFEEPTGLSRPSKMSLVSSSLSGRQPFLDFEAESQGLICECGNVISDSALNTTNERGIISNTLRELIESIEPNAHEASNKQPVAEPPSSSRNTAAINLGYCCYKVVEDVARKSGMKVIAHDKHWDVIWYSRPITEATCSTFSEHQRANYFPESQRAVWKNNLAICLTKMWKVFPREYDFFPKSWSLPRDWHLMEKYARRHPKDWYIVKPNNWGCGYGIYLTREVTKLSKCRKMTSQVYIQKPLLIDGLKFDLRIYVLVTSCKPLRIFVFNEGLARFATDSYQEPDHQNKTNKYMHLTNYAVNKYSPTYIVDETKGTLRRWTAVSEWLNEHEIDAKDVSASMDDVIIKTIIAMTPTLTYHYFRSFPDQADSNSCFQIFGFDIMFGSDLKVYVLEVNGSPQFYADVTLDIEMTKDLIRDTFNILNLAEKPQKPSSPVSKKNVWLGRKQDSRAVTQHRIDWENSHLGNFRKLYPSERNKYKKFTRAAEHFIRPL